MKKIDKRLENGLRLILIQKEGFVQSLGMIGIPAGGASIFQQMEEGLPFEHPSGVAHFLEHQMFYLNGEDVTKALSDQQAGSNAFTSNSQTCYFVWTAKDPIKPFETLIDFVQTLEVSDKTVEKEKGIILSEYMMYNQTPDARALREAMKSLYQHHPIKEDILGSIEDITNMRPDHLQRFYDAYYAPQNLVFVGITGRDIEPIAQKLEAYEKNYPGKAQKAVTFFGNEPIEVLREHFEDEMDVLKPYALLAIKLSCSKDKLSAYREDLLATMYFDAIFSALNPDFDNWLAEGIVSQSLHTEVDLNTDHAFILIETQTDKPDEFFKLVKKILAEKPKLSESQFLAEKNSEIATDVRAQEHFEILAADMIEACFDGLSLEEVYDLVRSLSLKEMNEWLEKTDFSHQAEILIKPKNRELEALTQEIELEPRSKQQSE